MNAEVIRHSIRGILIFIVQVLILKRMASGSGWWWEHAEILIYPIIVLLLPIRLARHYVTLIGFFIGIMIDLFYDTVGVHAFALTATAYARGLLLNYLEPRGGYTTAMSPTKHAMGLNWLLIFTAISYLIHTLVLYTVEVFTFVYIGKILLKSILAFLMSMLFVIGYHLLFNPRR